MSGNSTTESQNQMLLEALRNEPAGLTGLDMLYRFGILSHTRRIRDLRERGIPIGDIWEYQFNDKGKVVKHWKRYFLPREAAK